MKCVVTQKETLSKTKNIPLSIEGRTFLTDLTEAHNEKLKDLYVEFNKDKAVPEESVRKLAPQLTKTEVLRLLSSGEKDVTETRDTLLGE